MKCSRRWYRDQDPATRDNLHHMLWSAELASCGVEPMSLADIMDAERAHADECAMRFTRAYERVRAAIQAELSRHSMERFGKG